MENKKTRLIWGISLLVVGISSLIINISNIISFDIPDMLKRVLGIISLIGITVLVPTTVKLNIWKRKD